MKLTLYKASAEVEELLLADEIQEVALELAIESMTERAEAVLAVSDKVGNFVDYCKSEEKRIAEKRKYAENKQKRLKEYLQNCMEAAGFMEMEIGTKKAVIQKNPPKVIIDDEDLIPQEFKVIEQVTKIRKDEIKAALKSGEVPGAHTEQGFSLRIK